jgi:hypothetical protein
MYGALSVQHGRCSSQRIVARGPCHLSRRLFPSTNAALLTRGGVVGEEVTAVGSASKAAPCDVLGVVGDSVFAFTPISAAPERLGDRLGTPGSLRVPGFRALAWRSRER